MGLRYVYWVMMLCFGVVFSQDDITPITDTSLSLPQAPQPVQKSRAMQAQESYRNYLKILEHEGTYFLFYHSFTPIKDSLRPFLEQNELKFQLSAKLPLWRGAFWSKGTLFLVTRRQCGFSGLTSSILVLCAIQIISQVFFIPILQVGNLWGILRLSCDLDSCIIVMELAEKNAIDKVLAHLCLKIVSHARLPTALC